MTGCYLTTLPRQFMRRVAGFDPDYPGGYFLPRATVSPPLSLQRQMFPPLEGWQAAHLGQPDATEEVEGDMTAAAVLELLEKFRTVFLQVSTLFIPVEDHT